MKNDLKSVSYKVANASFLGAILVSIIHYRGHVMVGPPSGWFWEFFPGPMLKIAVPFFFVFAGYWLAGHMGEKGWWWREPFKRLKTLLLPFVVLNLLWFVMTTDSWTLCSFAKALGLVRGEYPALPQLWFVLRLFDLVVVAPVFYCIIKKGVVWSYCLFFAVYVALMCRECYCEHVGSSLLVIQMFKYIVPPVGTAGLILGMTFRFYGIPSVGFRWGWVLSVAGYGALLYSNLTMYSSGYGQFSVIGWFYLGLLVFGVGGWALVPSCMMWPWLTQSTFACYVLHYSFLRLFSVLLHWCGFSSYSSNTFLILVGVGGSVALSALCAQVLRRCNITRLIVLGGR